MGRVNDKASKHHVIAIIVCFFPSLLIVYSDRPLVLSLLLFFHLWALSVVDILSYRLPNILTLSLFIFGLIFAFSVSTVPLVHHGIGAIVGFLIFPLINSFYRRIRGHDGIGFGDAKLMAGVGMWFGWAFLPHVLLFASLSGLTVGGVTAFVQRKAMAQFKFPFGPFLCAGAWFTWLFTANQITL